jgi:hypothetical protein
MVSCLLLLFSGQIVVTSILLGLPRYSSQQPEAVPCRVTVKDKQR